MLRDMLQSDFHDPCLQRSTVIRVLKEKKLLLDLHWNIASIRYGRIAANQEVGQECFVLSHQTGQTWNILRFCNVMLISFKAHNNKANRTNCVIGTRKTMTALHLRLLHFFWVRFLITAALVICFQACADWKWLSGIPLQRSSMYQPCVRRLLNVPRRSFF